MPLDDSLQLVGTAVAEKYRVDALVAQGGFALLYRATHLIWKRPVALKVFKALGDASKANKEELLANFIREGALLADLSERSASICQARDVGMLTTPSGEVIPFMVLEWLEGRSLEQVLDEERAAGLPARTLPETLALLGPIGEALALAHTLGVAHRDVKPANIFLLGEPRAPVCPVKLLDFGIAKVVMDAQKAGGDFASTTGAMNAFTPSYAAPEQFSRAHGPTGPWTDTFSLALVAVECISGRPALEGDDFLQLAYSATNPARRPTPRALGVAVSDEVEAVFQRALSVDVAGRFPTVGEFWNELRQAGGKGPMSLLPPAQAREASTPSTSAPISRSSAPTPTPRAVAQLPPLEARRPPAVVVLGAAGAAFAALGIVGTLLVRHAGSAPVASSSPTATAAPLPSSLSAPVAPPPAPKAACPDGMVYVSGGQYFMGSDEGLPFEKPAHNIKLAPFCIDVHEVTTAKYLACSDAGKCKRAARANDWEGITPDDRKTYDPLCNARDADAKAQHPINCVDWERASTYCTATGGRLPSEAEWEFAARGSDGRTYPWGDAPPSAKHLNACGAECVAWGRAHHVTEKAMYKDDDGWANTAPVGSYPAGASKFGLMDVVGNVWEWVGDWYAPYTAGDLVDPKGPAEGTSRVMRGGAWNGAEASWVRPTFRFKSDPSLTSYGVGFRCAADPR